MSRRVVAFCAKWPLNVTLPLHAVRPSVRPLSYRYSTTPSLPRSLPRAYLPCHPPSCANVTCSSIIIIIPFGAPSASGIVGRAEDGHLATASKTEKLRGGLCSITPRSIESALDHRIPPSLSFFLPSFSFRVGDLYEY